MKNLFVKYPIAAWSITIGIIALAAYAIYRATRKNKNGNGVSRNPSIPPSTARSVFNTGVSGTVIGGIVAPSGGGGGVPGGVGARVGGGGAGVSK